MLADSNGKKFALSNITKLRSKESRIEYIHFLDRFASAMIGKIEWNAKRMLQPLGTYFSISDEAFLLVAYDCYQAKWIDRYKTKNKLYNMSTDLKSNQKVVREYSDFIIYMHINPIYNFI